MYNNLDPSFATDDPTGSGKIQQPDGRFDGRALRKQLRILREFMESLDFIHMQPDRSAVAIPPHPGYRQDEDLEIDERFTTVLTLTRHPPHPFG